MSKQKVTIAKNFSCHAWNSDLSQVALSKNNEHVDVFNTNGAPNLMKSWKEPVNTLTNHSGLVSAIDWHPETDFIVTSGHDRNAYVWKPTTYDDADGKECKKWDPTLVILRINRAATSVRWCPSGEKFAVSSGSKCVPVCHFEEQNNWWISKMIKKHKSTVLCLAWCPNNKFIVTGATDFKCRIFSAFIQDVDDIDNPVLAWKKANDFGQKLAEFDQAKAWVQGVSWSDDMMSIAFVGHGSTVHFVGLDASKAKNSESNVQTVYSPFLPNMACEFLSDEVFVAAGYDMNPQLYEKGDDGDWAFTKKLDDEVEVKSEKKKSVKSQWADRTDRGRDVHGKKKEKKGGIKTLHTNTIVDMKKISDTSFSTCGIDGRILIWNL